MKKVVVVILVFLALLGVGGFVAYDKLFGAVDPKSPQESTFVVPMKEEEAKTISRLKTDGFIKDSRAFNFVLGYKKLRGQIKPGGYNLAKNLNVWQLAQKVTAAPDMKWIVIKEGIRKEQIAELMATKFGWSQKDVDDWNDLYTRQKLEYLEGVYFPDTYLIPVSEKNWELAQRLINRFNEKFAPFVEKFYEKNIQWTTGLKIASLIERETGDVKDMPLISGIIWKRLEIDMRLQIDATLQYAKGKVGDKWWSLVKPEDKYIDSPYNTYQNKGLPPTPICNPGLDAIEAALNPTETECLFYLHDPSGTMHCAETYEEHIENVKKYL